MLLKRKKRRPLLRRFFQLFLTLVTLIVLGLAGLTTWLWQSLPQIEGSISVLGPTAPVEILRDDFGIPHIYASSPNDAYFGLGYAHAQDRMFQMEQQRRLSQGRLSEVLGSSTLANDRFLRLLDLHRAAQASVAALDPANRETLNAYAAGVNAFIEAHEGTLSPEFVLLLAADPAPWSAADSIAWLKVMALHLSGNWREEALRAAMINEIGAEKTASFFPDVPAATPSILDAAEGRSLGELSSLLNELLPPAGNGSNNWVVDGDHTSSGMPLLANDPHLGFSIPAVWYLAHLEAPGLSVAGATLPGIPLVIVGTNGEIAWGVTNTGPDTQDLFIERLDPEDNSRYLTPEGSESFAGREEVIEVRFGEDVTVSMLETRHGPILTGIRDQIDGLTRDDEAIALSWTMLQDDDRSIEAGLALHTASNWPEFVASARRYAGPQQNIVYADRRGNIGLLAPATIPIRSSGEGLVPVPGWTGEGDWIGVIPFHDLPGTLNPETGMIATANDKLVTEDYPYLLGHQWQPGYRGQRIRDLLAEHNDHDLASFSAIQLDEVSLFATVMLPFARESEPETENGRTLRAMLEAWDGDMVANSAAPTVYQAWYRELTRAIYADDLGEMFHDAWWFKPVFVLNVMRDDPQGWCLNAETGEETTCKDLAGIALDHAAEFLIERFGADPAEWQWGDVHALKLRHRLYGMIPGIEAMMGVDLPMGGDRFTVSTSGFVFNSDNRAFATVHGPVLRAVVDLSEPVTGYFVILPGQSGNPFSPYYDNLVDRWYANDPVPIPMDRTHIEVRHRLVLEPGNP